MSGWLGVRAAPGQQRAVGRGGACWQGALRFGACLCLGLALGVALPAAADTAHLRGFGPRALALAGSTEAESVGADVVYENPAQLAGLPTLQAGLGAMVTLPAYRVEQLRGAEAFPALRPQSRVLGQLAVASPLQGVLGGRLGVGGFLHLPVDGATRVLSHEPRRPQLPLVEALDDRLLLGLGVGARLLPGLEVGVTAQLLASLQGQTTVDLSALRGEIDEQVLEVDLWSRVTFAVGVRYALRHDLRLALVVRQASEVPYHLPLRADVAELGQVHYRVSGVGMGAPWTAALAGRWAPRERLMLLASVRYERWSAMPPLGPSVVVTADDAALAGDPSAAKALAQMASVPVAMGAKDIVQVRAGGEWQALRWLTLRAGAGIRPTPLPRATGTAKYLDGPSVTAALGAGLVLWRLPAGAPGLLLDVGASVAHLPRRTALSRASDDPVGGTSVEGQGWTLAAGLRHAL